MSNEPKCVAHGNRRCTWCTLNPADCATSSGSCGYYSETGMHWDTCPNRVSGWSRALKFGIELPSLGEGLSLEPDAGPDHPEVSTGFVTRDSGRREEFQSGAKRDTQEGKPRYDLVPAAPLKRLAELMARGAVKYGDHNWMKGMPASRFLASMMRHVEAYRLGERDEDHLAAVVFNAFAIMFFEGTDWDDIN